MTTTTLKSTQGSQSLQLGSVSGLWVNCRPSGLHLLQSVKSLAISFIQRVLVGAPSLAGAQEATLQPFRRNNQGIGINGADFRGRTSTTPINKIFAKWQHVQTLLEGQRGCS